MIGIKVFRYYVSVNIFNFGPNKNRAKPLSGFDYTKKLVLNNLWTYERGLRNLQVIISLKLYNVWYETILYMLANNKTLILVLDRTYKCTIGMKIL